MNNKQKVFYSLISIIAVVLVLYPYRALYSYNKLYEKSVPVGQVLGYENRITEGGGCFCSSSKNGEFVRIRWLNEHEELKEIKHYRISNDSAYFQIGWSDYVFPGSLLDGAPDFLNKHFLTEYKMGWAALATIISVFGTIALVVVLLFGVVIFKDWLNS